MKHLQAGLGCGILFVAMFGLLIHYSGDSYPFWKQAVAAAVGIIAGVLASLHPYAASHKDPQP